MKTTSKKHCSCCCAGWVSENEPCKECNIYEALSSELKKQHDWFKQFSKDLQDLRNIVEEKHRT